MRGEPVWRMPGCRGRWWRLHIVLLLALGVACDAGAERVEHTRPFFDRSPWHDGQAEVNFYDATEIRYDERRRADEAVLIFVKEDHLPDAMVKADDPREGDLPAVKLNWVTAIPTGIYTYRQQASVFVNRETNRPFRETFASHEWCGNTFKDLRQANGGPWRYQWSSYFEDDADGQRQVATDAAADATPTDRPVVPADALPLYVRTVDRNHAVTALPSLRSIRAEPGDFEPTEARIELGEREQLTVPAGTFAVQPVRVTYADGREDLFVLEAGPRRRLVKMQLADGSIYELRRSVRTDYWNRNRPGDEALRDGLGVD